MSSKRFAEKLIQQDHATNYMKPENLHIIHYPGK
jgi:hypothetical protein